MAIANGVIGDIELLGFNFQNETVAELFAGLQPFNQQRFSDIFENSLAFDPFMPPGPIVFNQAATQNFGQKESVLSSGLYDLLVISDNLSQANTDMRRDELFDQARATTAHATFVEEFIVIDAFASDEASAAQLLADLTSLGLTFGSSFSNAVSGLLPLSMIGELEGLDGLVSVSETSLNLNVGSVTTQADSSARAEDGLSIGVLSDSFDNLGGFATDIATGDLPSNVNVLLDLSASEEGSDEGRAILQLIADIAPGSDLLFHTAFLGIASFANGIIALANAGADIIIDDVSFFASPFFQDGLIAQAVDQVAAQGVLYFSSAGNAGTDSYRSEFRASNGVIAGINTGGNGEMGQLHDFNPGAGVDNRQLLSLGDEQELLLSFQYDEATRVGPSSQGPVSDFDIYLLEAGTNNIVAVSDSSNATRAVEVISFTNETGSTQQYELVINRFEGSNNNLLQYIDFSGAANFLEFTTNSPTVVGQANAAGAVAVGAAAFFNTPDFGVTPPRLNGFSSVGGVDILFDVQGNRLPEPDVRRGPAFTAPDGGNTTFFGNDIGFDADTFPNFFGTSASAPAAAAIAALLLEAVPNATPDQVIQALIDTAIDIGPAGIDPASGAGLIQADLAIEALQNSVMPPPLGPTPNDDTLNGTDGADIINGLAGNDLILGLAGNDILDGDLGNDVLEGDAGDDVLNGGDGNDTLRGGDGNDTATGGNGFDRIDGAAGADLISGGANNDVLTGSLGNDTITGDAGNDFIGGGGENDLLDGGDGNDTIEGGLGADNVTGGTGADLLIGDAGNDTLAGGTNLDTLLGGEGDDSLLGEGAADSVSGGNGNDFIDGAAGDDTLVGGAGNDTIEGGENGADVINGDEGDDIISGGSGFDTLSGGDGFDQVNGDEGADSIEGGAGDDVLNGGSNLDTINGGDGDDTIDGGGAADTIIAGNGLNIVIGGAGNDNLTGGDDADNLTGGTGADTLTGGAGNDTLAGGTNLDLLNGGAGDDSLLGEGAADTINGGDGNDFISGAAGNDVGFGDAGDDTLLGGENGADSLDGGDGNDSISGGSNFDTLLGGTGNDTIFGDTGADNLDGGAGDDSLNGGTNLDTIIGGAGNDTIDGGGAADLISVVSGLNFIIGGAGNDTVTGGSDSDTIDGGSGADNLDGDAGNDTIDGGSNLDTITGGDGDDILTGGGAGDRFVFADNFGNDRITDFTIGSVGANPEQIDLSALTGITDLNDLTTNHLSADPVTGDAIITDGSNTITLEGISLGDLTADDFIF